MRGDAEWRERMESDARQIARRVPAHLRELHSAVVERAAVGRAAALILTGSTARGSRTDSSDLDYHLIGNPVDTSELSRELDLHVLANEALISRLLAGDDFVHWSLQFGLIVFDAGPVRLALTLIEEGELWPDPTRKREHAIKSLDLAGRFVATGDEGGAVVQVRTALSLAARAYLLGIGIFPLSRAELPDQLRVAGELEVASALAASIHKTPSLDELAHAVVLGDRLLCRPPKRPQRSHWEPSDS